MSHKIVLNALLVATLTGCNRSGPSSATKHSEPFPPQTFTALNHPDRIIVLASPTLCATFIGYNRIVAGYTRHENRLRLEPFQWNAAPVRNFIVTANGLVEEPVGIGELYVSVEALEHERITRERNEREKERRAADEEFRKKADEQVQKMMERATHPHNRPLDGLAPPNPPTRLLPNAPTPRNPRAYHSRNPRAYNF